MTRRKQIKREKIYAAISPDFGPRFAFNASDQEDADHLMHGWNCYQGFYGIKDVAHTTREIAPADLETLRISIHNEWVL